VQARITTLTDQITQLNLSGLIHIYFMLFEVCKGSKEIRTAHGMHRIMGTAHDWAGHRKKKTYYLPLIGLIGQ
jgi:hypothetical protein